MVESYLQLYNKQKCQPTTYALVKDSNTVSCGLTTTATLATATTLVGHLHGREDLPIAELRHKQALADAVLLFAETDFRDGQRLVWFKRGRRGGGLRLRLVAGGFVA